MDGLECSVLTLRQVRSAELRFDSDYYSRENLSLSEKLNTVGSKTISEYGGRLDCSAFYPSIRGSYTANREDVPFLRVNEIKNGLISITDGTVFLPAQIVEENSNTIALAYPGDIIIAKGGNTLAKVGLVTDEYPRYATCRDVIILRTDSLVEVNKYYLWAFLHSDYGQSILWRSASQTGQPHLTLPAIMKIRVPDTARLQDTIEWLYKRSVQLNQQAECLYNEAASILSSAVDIHELEQTTPLVTEKPFSESFLTTGRLDAEYYQPKYDQLLERIERFACKPLGGDVGIVSINKSIEPGSDAYQEEGIPFVRVSDISKYGISEPELFLPSDIVKNPEVLFPKKDTILFSKDGSVGIAYKVENDMRIITSGAILHLVVQDVEEVLPDYLTLVLNSPVVQLQAERDSNGAIIRHWKPSDIEKVMVPILDMPIQRVISKKVRESFALRQRSQGLIECAKCAVETAIENNEDEALEWLKEQVR